MQTLMDKTKTGLIKRFHTLLGKLNMDNEQKLEILAQYGVESSKDMNTYELLELCNRLDKQTNPKLQELDNARKRLLASIFSWRKAMGCSANINEVKAIACRAADADDFNKISVERLKSLYYAFGKKVKDLEKATTQKFITTKLMCNEKKN